MQQSQGDFFSIQTLPPGVYYYRFIVDGKWQTDPGQPMATDINGEINNIIEIGPTKEENFSTFKGTILYYLILSQDMIIREKIELYNSIS